MKGIENKKIKKQAEGVLRGRKPALLFSRLKSDELVVRGWINGEGESSRGWFVRAKERKGRAIVAVRAVGFGDVIRKCVEPTICAQDFHDDSGIAGRALMLHLAEGAIEYQGFI